MMSVNLLVWRRNMAAVLTKPTAGIKKDMDCGPWGIGQANLGEKKIKIRRKQKKKSLCCSQTGLPVQCIEKRLEGWIRWVDGVLHALINIYTNNEKKASL